MGERLRAQLRRVLAGESHAVLAISGGLDSMVLLDVAAAVRDDVDARLMIATFDHASSARSAQAAAFVAEEARERHLEVVVGRASSPGRSEAAWREARWDFLRAAAAAAGTRTPVVTAHTRDDQVETVLLRILRGAGARGLAALAAPSSAVRRPFLEERRADLAEYARARALRWVEDPTNVDRRYLRNRVRHDLLPALRAVRPSIDEALIDIGRRAAEWRRELALLVDERIPHRMTHANGAAQLSVPRAALAALDVESLALVWPELAARAGATLDRHGTRRAAEFTTSGRTGSLVPLSGGWRLTLARNEVVLDRDASNHERDVDGTELPPDPAVIQWNRWRFSRLEGSGAADTRDSPHAWRAELPAGARLTVRSWRPGDRMRVRQLIDGHDRVIERKVKYFLSDAGISGHQRAGWPVVLAGDEIVWIPGVRRGGAATDRSGRPAVTYVCDYLDR